MSESPFRLIKCCAEFLPKDKVELVPPKRRGLYVLYRFGQREDGAKVYDVLYVGMARKGIRSRLQSHVKTKTEEAGKPWTHFSAFEVWDNIRDDEIVELEGLFRHIYRKDSVASRFNKQRTFKKLAKLRRIDLRK